MRLNQLVMVGGLVIVAACGKKTAGTLPPPPPQTTMPQAAATDTGTGQLASTGATPGSLEDFRRSVRSDKVLFAYDSYELDGAARGVLDAQAQWLSRYPAVGLTIEGHADERGTREYNIALGERRANQVKSYLSGKGVSAGRIATISYGKERPEVEGADDQSWAANRRAVTVPGAGLTS